MGEFGTPNINSERDSVLLLNAFKYALKNFEEIRLRTENINFSSETVEEIVLRLNRILKMSEGYLFTTNDFKIYWEDIFKIVEEFNIKIDNNYNLSENDLKNYLIYLDRAIGFLMSSAHEDYLISVKNKIDKIKESVGESSSLVASDIERYMRLRNIADNAKTENIYHEAVDKYRGLESNYRMYFYSGIGVVVTISVLLLFCKTLIVPNFFSNIEFWILKGSILIVGITLITYFLKQSSHYQHLADQNYQTQVELQAYPSFMESIPVEEAASVRKELALKYFGREIDGAAHKDMSNLIADQMKSTTEMVKASTEAIKNLKDKP